MVHNLSQVKKYILLSIIYLHTVLLYSQSIEVCGTISSDTQWEIDTIKVTCDVTVEDDVTLTINPGVIVEFQDSYKIDVYGSLLAVGGINDSIRFTIIDTTSLSDTSINTGGWQGIRFNNGWQGANGAMDDNDSSLIEYCIIEYVKNVFEDKNLGAIQVDNFSKLRVANNFIRNNISLHLGGGISCFESGMQILKNTFIKNKAYKTGGGAIDCRNSQANISQNIMQNNYTEANGGGICCTMSDSSTIFNNVISRNVANNGGGIYISNNSPVSVLNNIILKNSAQTGGGGVIIIHDSKVDIINNAIVSNNADNGGGILCFGNNTNIINNTICFNHSENNFGGGGGVYIRDCQPTIVNTILWHNTASNTGPQIFLEKYTDPIDVGINYSNIEGGLEGFGLLRIDAFEGIYTNNIQKKPHFENNAENNFRILRSSPGINMGIPDTMGFSIPQIDLGGNERVQQNRIDIGAYESEGTSPRIHLSVDSLTLYSNAPFASVKQSCCECYEVDNTKSGPPKNTLSQFMTGLAIPDDIKAYWKDRSIVLPVLKSGKTNID